MALGLLDAPRLLPVRIAKLPAFLKHLLHKTIAGEDPARAPPILITSAAGAFREQGVDLFFQHGHSLFKRRSGHRCRPAFKGNARLAVIVAALDAASKVCEVKPIGCVEHHQVKPYRPVLVQQFSAADPVRAVAEMKPRVALRPLCRSSGSDGSIRPPSLHTRMFVTWYPRSLEPIKRETSLNVYPCRRHHDSTSRAR